MLRKARRASPVKLRRLLTGDLDLIVLHALYKEPERRYATAGQFAEDIDHFLQLRPIRRTPRDPALSTRQVHQRHPVAVTLTLFLMTAMAAGLVGLAFSLRQVRREHDRLESSFQVARNAVDEVFTRIDEQRQIEAPGLQPVRATLLNSLLRYYENILDLQGNDPGARVLAAEAQHRIARINYLIGLPDVAAWQLQRTIDRYEELVAHDPREIRYQNDLASILNELGEMLLSIESRAREALPCFERAQSLLEVRSAAKSEAIAHPRELARVLSNIAEVERAASHPDRARMNLTRAISILDGLVAANSQRIEDRIALAADQVALGRVLAASPEAIDQAVAALTRGVDLRRAITREYPDRFDQSHELALDLGEQAAIEQKAGRFEAAIQSENQALELLEQLDRRFPDRVSYQRDLYISYDMAGQLYSQLGDTKLALQLASQARTVLERLVDQHPREFIFQIHLARSHGFIGRLLYRSQRFTDALRSFQRAVDLLESLPQVDSASSYQLAVNLALCVSLIGAGPAAPPSR